MYILCVCIQLVTIADIKVSRHYNIVTGGHTFFKGYPFYSWCALSWEYCKQYGCVAHA